MSLIHKQVNDLAKAVGREIRHTNNRIDELAVKVLIDLKNDTSFTIAGKQLILLDGNMKPNAITNAMTPKQDKQRYRGGFRLEHIYFYSGDKVRPFSFFKKREIYSRYPTVDFKLSSNCGIFLEPNKPVYLICGYDEETNLYYLAKKWWTQKLPEKDDGLVYKHIGFARPNQRLQFFNDGAIYQFKNNKIIVSYSAQDKEIATDEELNENSTNAISNQAVTVVVNNLSEKIEQIDINLSDIIESFDYTYENGTNPTSDEPTNPTDGDSPDEPQQDNP